MPLLNKLKLYTTTFSLLSIVQACSTLPERKPIDHQAQQPIPQCTAKGEGYFQQLFESELEQHKGLTGFHLLTDPLEAFAVRLQLIDEAERSVDLQYYIWNNDHIGSMAVHRIIKAADRGVKVRLLLDDQNSKGMSHVAAALSKHRNVEVRLFNPYRFRKARLIDGILDFKRVNRRMHNKSISIDGEVALIGGRNMSNQYYNASDSYQFSDVDVLLVGTSVDQIQESFELYWNHPVAYPVLDIVSDEDKQLTFSELKQQISTHENREQVQSYLDLANYADSFSTWYKNREPMQWVKAKVIYDSPDKILSKTNHSDDLPFQLDNLIQQPVKQVDLISAYFIPQEEGAKQLVELQKSGVNVRVLTNSVAANDVPVVHSFYSKYRRPLLEGGVQLYEFLPVLPLAGQSALLRNRFLGDEKKSQQTSRSSLHAKMMVIDQSQVFIGSFNFDPRSAYYNTEIGVVLESPELGKKISDNMDRTLSLYSYRVSVNEDGKMQWQQTYEDNDYKIYDKEPRTKRWQRGLLKLIGKLPVERYM